MEIKKAVENNEISLDEANNILIKQKRDDNLKVVSATTRDANKSFSRIFTSVLAG